MRSTEEQSVQRVATMKAAQIPTHSEDTRIEMAWKVGRDMDDRVKVVVMMD